MDHVRQSDDGSRSVMQGKKPSKSYLSTNKEEKKWPAGKIRIKLWAYEHSLVDQAAGAHRRDRSPHRLQGVRPDPASDREGSRDDPRAPHKCKDSREQFEQRTHKRLIDVQNPTRATFDAMEKLDLPLVWKSRSNCDQEVSRYEKVSSARRSA